MAQEIQCAQFYCKGLIKLFTKIEEWHKTRWIHCNWGLFWKLHLYHSGCHTGLPLEQFTSNHTSIYSVDDDLQHTCFSFISEFLVHDTSGVHLFQKKLVSHLKETYSEIQKIYYFSDGAAGQYQNKKNFVDPLYHEQDFQVSTEWHFFATSHGKGPCDGVGGTIKWIAAHASLQGTMITSPTELYKWAKSNVEGILFSFTSNEEHENEAHYFQNL